MKAWKSLTGKGKDRGSVKKSGGKKKSKKPVIIQGCKEIQHESLKDYKKGGYHPVQIGDYLDEDNYLVAGKLGWGHFSTVWLCYDFNHKDFVAVKVVKSARHYAEAAIDEIKLCTDVKGCQGIVQLYDHFMLRGPNGKHMCLVFELVGENLLSIIRKFQDRTKAVPMELIKQVIRDMLLALVELGRAGMIHTDIKPENILFSAIPKRVQTIIDEFKPPESRPKRKKKRKQREIGIRETIRPLEICSSKLTAKVCKLADFGNACWVDKQFTEDIQTRQYRAPEVIIKQGYSTPTDVWSLAACIFELVTYDYLFNPKGGKYYTKNEDHLAQMVELLGPMNHRLTRVGRDKAKYFEQGTGGFKHIKKLKFWDLKSVLIEKYGMEHKDAHSVGDFLLAGLHFNPMKRATPEELLAHYWLGKPKIPIPVGMKECEKFIVGMLEKDDIEY